MIFSIINAVSLTYCQDDAKERAIKSDQVRIKMMKLTQVCEQIYKAINQGDSLNLNYELRKKEYNVIR